MIPSLLPCVFIKSTPSIKLPSSLRISYYSACFFLRKVSDSLGRPRVDMNILNIHNGNNLNLGANIARLFN